MTTSKSSKPNPNLGAPPTDLELMLFADDELDELRHRQVEVYVVSDSTCRSKVANLQVAAGVLRENALSSCLADQITDAVMKRIVLENNAPLNDKKNLHADNGVEGASLSTSDLATRSPKVAAPVKPANDNSRWIFTLAGIAAAAAAGMMIWGRMESPPPSSMQSPPAPIQKQVAPPVATPLNTSTRQDGADEHGVEVAAVDFGPHMGTIFYVPQTSDALGPTTTVVWLSDEGPGGE